MAGGSLTPQGLGTMADATIRPLSGGANARRKRKHANMNNPIVPTVSIELGGKQRELVYNLNSFAALEEKLGRSLFGEDGFNFQSFRELRLFLWAAFLHGEPTITPDEVGAMISTANLNDVQVALAKAMEVSTPEKSADPTSAVPAKQ